MIDIGGSVISSALVTGVAPLSLGEAIMIEFLDRDSVLDVCGLDLLGNRELRTRAKVHLHQMDLNPLTYGRGISGFADELQVALEGILDASGSHYFSTVVQAAGIHDYGDFLEYSTSRRSSLLGVNFIGHVEVLHAAMAINASRSVANSDLLTFGEIGSFQGLSPRAGRSLYASSKAAMVDFCASLHFGDELSRVVYFAPGPIDTPMLHRNQWRRVNGPIDLFNEAYKRRDLYPTIFERCDPEAAAILAQELRLDAREVVECMRSYRLRREEAHSAELGILRREDTARIIVDVLVQPNTHPAGVYLLRASGDTTGHIEYSDFESMRRFFSEDS